MSEIKQWILYSREHKEDVASFSKKFPVSKVAEAVEALTGGKFPVGEAVDLGTGCDMADLGCRDYGFVLQLKDIKDE